MHHPLPSTGARSALLAIALLLSVWSCSELPTTAGLIETHASGGGGKGKNGSSGTGEIVVSAVEPAYGAPGQALTVRVLGSNFDTDAAVGWQRDGATGEITTLATRFVSASELESDITIAEDATLDLYDVIVQSKTRSGIGTEKFEVTQLVSGDCGGRTTLLDSHAALDWGSTLSIRNDDRGAYLGGEGSVHAKILYHDESCASGGDIVFDADRSSQQNPRKLVFMFPPNAPTPGRVEAGPHVLFVAAMQLGSFVSEAGGVDATIYRKVTGPRSRQYPAISADRPGYPSAPDGTPYGRFQFQNMGVAGCGKLEYDHVRMTRTSSVDAFEKLGYELDGIPAGKWSEYRPGQWRVESVPTTAGGANGHWARCITTKGQRETAGAWMNMPFSVTVTEVRRW